MKRAVVVFALLLSVTLLVGASEVFYAELSDAQRYDLADAYDRVADRFDELGENQRAERFRAMVEIIFPGFSAAQRPAEQAPEATPPPRRPEKQAPDPAGGDASFYYFNKLLRGVFNENLPIVVSVVGDVLYLPMFDQGIDRAKVTSELQWFFETYEVDSVAPHDVFNMQSIAVTPLDNGYWRLDVETWPEYEGALPEVTFWAGKMGFYFRKYPEGWRLAAIGPVA